MYISLNKQTHLANLLSCLTLWFAWLFKGTTSTVTCKCSILTTRQRMTSQGCILAGISFFSISSILLPTRKSGIRRDKYLSAAIFKEAVHSDDS